MRSFSMALLSGAALLAAACASQPEPDPVPEVPVTNPGPAPAPTPAPTPTTQSGPAAGSKAHFAANTTDRVYFGYDQYNLDDEDRRVLQAQAAWLRQYPGTRVQIEGNADERGTREYNIALGQRRAESAASYLAAQGVDSSRITTVSWGKDRPLDPGNNEAAWSRNRNAYTNVVTEAGS